MFSRFFFVLGLTRFLAKHGAHLSLREPIAPIAQPAPKDIRHNRRPFPVPLQGETPEVEVGAWERESEQSEQPKRRCEGQESAVLLRKRHYNVRSPVVRISWCSLWATHYFFK